MSTDKNKRHDFQAEVDQISLKAQQHAVKSAASLAQIKTATVFNRSGIPLRFQGKRLDDFISVNENQVKAKNICSRYASSFSKVRDQGVCMVLTGSFGTGKTHLACAILQEIMSSGYSGYFVTVSEMLRIIRGTYSPSSKLTEREAFESFKSPDLLVLDEVGVSVGDAKKRKALIFDVINARYGDLKPTIIQGNLTPDQMKDYLGDPVWDRLMEFEAPIISFDWVSYRRNKRGCSQPQNKKDGDT